MGEATYPSKLFPFRLGNLSKLYSKTIYEIYLIVEDENKYRSF